MTSEKITQEEMVELFGEEMPIEAANLLFDAPDDWTVDDVRRKLREIAALAARPAPEAGSVVERLREHDARVGSPIALEAADLIQAQAAQIASLSAKVAEVERERDEARKAHDADAKAFLSAYNRATAAEARASELQREVEQLREALSAMLKEHDILSGNYGDVMDRKHLSPDRWPSSASKARAALQQEGKSDDQG